MAPPAVELLVHGETAPPSPVATYIVVTPATRFAAKRPRMLLTVVMNDWLNVGVAALALVVR